MITKEQFANSYIVNDHGVLKDKYLELASSFGYIVADSGYDEEVLFKGTFNIVQQWSTLEDFKSDYFHKHTDKLEITLKDFTEAPKNDTGGVSKWKYNSVDTEDCLFGLKDKYTNGELYVLYEGDYLKVSNQTQLAEGFITNTLYTP